MKMIAKTDTQVYTMFATDFELNELAKKIYAYNRNHAFKISLEKKVKEGAA